MSKIKDVESAVGGLSRLLGTTPTPTSGELMEETELSTKEEIEDTLSDETKEALREEIHRRQHRLSGRPPGSTKGTPRKTPETISMTFRIKPEKQQILRDIAFRKGVLISEILERGIDLVIAEYKSEDKV